MLTLYIGFVGRRFQKKYCRIHHANVSAICEAILQKWRLFFNVMRLIFQTMRQRRNVTVVSTHIIYGQRNGVEAFLYCQLEGAVGDETVTLARQQSTDIFFLVR